MQDLIESSEHAKSILNMSTALKCALWRWMPKEATKASCSFAAVLKKDGEAQRTILQVCPFNDAAQDIEEMFYDVPEYGLVGAEALAAVPTAAGQYHFATVDESNAFTHVVVPAWWHFYQAAPSVCARQLPRDWVGEQWWCENKTLSLLYTHGNGL